MDSMTDISLHANNRASIHPTAIVAHGAELGPGVEIGPFCTVGPNVVIEAGAKLVSHVVVEGHTRIGEGAQLFPFCTVGLAPQDMKYKNEPTRCEIGARTLVREHCTIHRGTATGIGVTRVGTDCMLMAVVHVAHDCHDGQQRHRRQQRGDGRPCQHRRSCRGRRRRRDPPVRAHRPRRDDRRRIGRRSRRHPVRQRHRQPRSPRRAEHHRPAPPRLRQSSDPAPAHRVQGAVHSKEGVFAQRLEATRARFGGDPLVAEVLAFIDAPSHAA